MRTLALLLAAALLSGCTAARLARHSDDLGRAAAHGDDAGRAASHADAHPDAHLDDSAADGPSLDAVSIAVDAQDLVLEGQSESLEEDLREAEFADFVSRWSRKLRPGFPPGQGAPDEVARAFEEHLGTTQALPCSEAENVDGSWVQWAGSGGRFWVIAYDPQTQVVRNVTFREAAAAGAPQAR